mgnify:CR=1 FL=1
MFTKYELSVLREALIENWESWQERVERGDDISERFMSTFPVLEEKIDRMIDGGAWKATHRHVKRGTGYHRMATAKMQATDPVTDMQTVEIYQGEDGQWWVRPTSEFNDGRFEEV